MVYNGHEYHPQNTVLRALRQQIIIDILGESANDYENFTKEDAFGKRQHRTRIPLWKFLLHLLMRDTHCRFVQWSTKSRLEFRIKDPHMLAELWGSVKDKSDMTYEKFGRAIRYYYGKKIIEKVPGKRFSYKFILSKRTYKYISNFDLNVNEESDKDTIVIEEPEVTENDCDSVASNSSNSLDFSFSQPTEPTGNHNDSDVLIRAQHYANESEEKAICIVTNVESIATNEDSLPEQDQKVPSITLNYLVAVNNQRNAQSQNASTSSLCNFPIFIQDASSNHGSTGVNIYVQENSNIKDPVPKTLEYVPLSKRRHKDTSTTFKFDSNQRNNTIQDVKFNTELTQKNKQISSGSNKNIFATSSYNTYSTKRNMSSFPLPGKSVIDSTLPNSSKSTIQGKSFSVKDVTKQTYSQSLFSGGKNQDFSRACKFNMGFYKDPFMGTKSLHQLSGTSRNESDLFSKYGSLFDDNVTDEPF